MAFCRASAASIAARTLSRRAGSAFMRLRRRFCSSHDTPPSIGAAAALGRGLRLRLEDDRVGVEVVVAAALEVLGVRAREVARPVRRHLEDARRELRDEPAIVGHEEDRPLERLQALDERVDGLEVEVVGRLVEHEHVGLLDDDARRR